MISQTGSALYLGSFRSSRVTVISLSPGLNIHEISCDGKGLIPPVIES